MKKILTIASLLISSFAAPAGDFDFANTSNEQDFNAIVRDLTAALGYKAMHPAETGGIAGIEVAAIVTYAPTQEQDAWQRMTGSGVDELGMAGLRGIKGLPLGFEIGAFYSAIPGTGGTLLGGEVRYAILEGGVASPAIAVRGAYSRLQNVDDLDFDSRSLDVSISKGFTLLTPYGGIGRVWADARGDLSTGSTKANHEDTRVFAGLRIGLGLLDITPEYERIGDNDIFNVLVGLSF